MWIRISAFIIQYRLSLLIATACLTIFFGYMGTRVEMTYDFVKVVPESDPSMKYYRTFHKTFGEDGNILVVGMQDNKLFEVNNFRHLFNLSEALKKVKGVKGVISLPTQLYLRKDDTEKKFKLENVFTHIPNVHTEVDSLLKVAESWKIYDGLLYNPVNKATLLALTIDKAVLNSADRTAMMDAIQDAGKIYTQKTKINIHYAGLPYVRAVMIKEVKSEFNFFLIFSALVTCLILYLFFRSVFAVFFTFLVILILISLTLGTLALLNYKITLLTGILPALIVIISIPNCVYMYNKYHREIRHHGNKIKAISRIIQKVGFLTFMTNANTAVGFLVLVITDINVIREFGVVAGIVSLATFLVTIVVIPALLFYMPSPKPKDLKHLDLKYLKHLNVLIERIVLRHKSIVYFMTIILMMTAVFGIFKIESRSYMVDDLPKKSQVKEDLAFFEKHFTGVMPLEVVVDFHKNKAVYNPNNLNKLEEFELKICEEKCIATPMSLTGLLKTAHQAYYYGDSNFYSLPQKKDLIFLNQYIRNSKGNNLGIAFTDSLAREARISCKIADIGSDKMDEMVARIQKQGDSIFGKKADIFITGSSLLFLKGNQYLINDLTGSLILGFILISLMMAMIFSDIKMILISLVPNVIPMILTAGIMGIFGIPLKPSTALIFSISFGISIDSTIHYLSKFKQELKNLNGDVKTAVLKSLEESGVSIIYTSLVLFGGFVIFCFSDFGGTVALGMLTSITLVLSMVTNLTLLPILIINFYKAPNENKKGFKSLLINKKARMHQLEGV